MKFVVPIGVAMMITDRLDVASCGLVDNTKFDVQVTVHRDKFL